MISKVQKWRVYSNMVVCVSHSTWACLLMRQKKRQEKWHDNSQFPLKSSHRALIPFDCVVLAILPSWNRQFLYGKKNPNFIAFVVFSFFIEFGWCTECAELIAKFSFENVKKDCMSLRACWCSDRIFISKWANAFRTPYLRKYMTHMRINECGCDVYLTKENHVMDMKLVD